MYYHIKFRNYPLPFLFSVWHCLVNKHLCHALFSSVWKHCSSVHRAFRCITVIITEIIRWSVATKCSWKSTVSMACNRKNIKALKEYKIYFSIWKEHPQTHIYIFFYSPNLLLGFVTTLTFCNIAPWPLWNSAMSRALSKWDNIVLGSTTPTGG